MSSSSSLHRLSASKSDVSASVAAFGCIAAVAVGVAAAAPSARAASLGPGDIRMIDFGGTGTFDAVAGDISNAGIVIGAYTKPTHTQPALDPGFTNLPIEQLPEIVGHTNSPGRIAKNGSAVGGLSSGTPFTVWYRPGVPGTSVFDAGSLAGRNTEFGGINASGVFVGTSQTASGDYHAFRHPGTPNGTMVDLGTLNGIGDSNGSDINDAGVIVGWSHTDAFVLRPGGTMQSLGKLPGVPTSILKATALNEPGIMVGSALIPGDRITDPSYHVAFRHNGGVNDAAQALPTLGGFNTGANDINDLGFVAGSSQLPGADPIGPIGGPSHAVVWRPDNSLVDLDAYLDLVNPVEGAKWSLVTATALNNSGMIVGYGTFNDGPGGLTDGTRGYILDASDIVPEPAGLAAFGLGAAALLRRPSRRRS